MTLPQCTYDSFLNIYNLVEAAIEINPPSENNHNFSRPPPILILDLENQGTSQFFVRDAPFFVVKTTPNKKTFKIF